MTITAKIIADSISSSGIRITTMELNYPRFIHSEFMTHRMFSRNASSSRAIPVEKMIKQVEEKPAIPTHWGRNQPGMQARELIEDEMSANVYWKDASQRAIDNAYNLKDLGVHKQIVNRLLEPFQYIKVIVTATEWDNFFKLRLHADAQPEMQELARVMKEAMEASSPQKLAPGEWHLPYVNDNEIIMGQICDEKPFCINLDDLIKCSIARCARVSYLNHDNSSPDIEKDLQLADKLLEAGHLSPFEHIATPMESWRDRYSAYEPGVTHIDTKGNLWSGNFKSWIQHRQLLSAV